jgi:hypothetical protein
MALTQYGNYRLSVRENHEGKPFLMLEPGGKDAGVLNGGFVQLRLRDGTTYTEAQALAEQMRSHISGAALALGVPPNSP